MTREEAIRLIGWLKCTTNREDDLEAIDMAIEALQRQTDGDLISRADAMAEFREWVKRANENGETPTWNDAVSLIGSLPSADAVQGWIPCSERLPEKDDLVLVTVWNDVTIAWRNIYGGWESAEDMYEKGDVIAWMPLPSPYREDGEA